jgi:hypothetical protein
MVGAVCIPVLSAGCVQTTRGLSWLQRRISDQQSPNPPQSLRTVARVYHGMNEAANGLALFGPAHDVE